MKIFHGSNQVIRVGRIFSFDAEIGYNLVENGWLICRNLADSGRFLQDDASSA